MRGGRGKRVALGAGILALMILGLAAWRAWPYFRFRWLFEPLGMNAQGYPEYRHRKTGIVFVSLRGGKLLMGAQNTDRKAPNYDSDAQPDEAPVHEVELSPFLMAKYKVNKAQWKQVMSENPSGSKGANLPMKWLRWEDCQEFCRKTGLKLPTEAQWEFGWRGNTPEPYARTGWIERLAFVFSGGRPHLVGKRKPNGFGLEDMQGDVWEWCEDVYDESFYSSPKASGPDPVCTSGSEDRVLRGGAFGIHREHACSASGGKPLPNVRYLDTDFRLAAPAF